MTLCGGNGTSVGNIPSSGRVDELVRASSQTQDIAQYKTEVNALLADSLREANSRDAETINRHLDTVRQALEGLVNESMDLRFGGSISKHTYVDGISDVDVLAVLSKETAENASPQDLISDFAAALRSRLPNTDIDIGRISVKVHFSDGTDIQVLPSFPVRNGYKIPRYQGDSCSGVIRPHSMHLVDIVNWQSRVSVPCD